MFPCLKPLPVPSTDHSFASLTSQGYSTDNTPTSSVPISPKINLTGEYNLAIHTNSYGEIRRTFTENFSFDHNLEAGQLDVVEESQLVEQFLQPSHDDVQEALMLIKLKSLAGLFGDYFEQSENALRLCAIVYQRVQHARQIYRPIHDALDDLPLEYEWDSFFLASPQCKLAFDSFFPLDDLKNPFFSLDSHRFGDIRSDFTHLRQQVDSFKRSRSKLLFNFCSGASCGRNCRSHGSPRHNVPRNGTSFSQLEAAARGAFVVQGHLNTIDRLVARLHSSVDNDKRLIRLGLGQGMDRYSIQEMLKQLQRNWPSFDQQLQDLEQHLFLCFAAINKARCLVYQEIYFKYQQL